MMQHNCLSHAIRAALVKGLAASLSLLICAQASAQEQQWWFDIELILYKRDLDASQISEQFEKGLRQANNQETFELLHSLVQPNLDDVRRHLPSCAQERPILPLRPTLPEIVPASIFAPIVFTPILRDEEDHIAAATSQDALSTPDRPLPEAAKAMSRSEHVAQKSLYTTAQASEALPEHLRVPDWQPIEFIEFYDCAIAPQEHRKLTASQVPLRPQGSPNARGTAPQLLRNENLQLTELATSLSRQRGLSLMMHMAWRQQVLFGRDNGKGLHLIAGQNFAKQYAQDGMALIDSDHSSAIVASAQHELASSQVFSDIEQLDNSDSLLTKIRLALASNAPLAQEQIKQVTQQQQRLEELWEVDGRVKVFLRYINRTPYLHIDGDLDFRGEIFEPLSGDLDTSETVQPLTPQRLQSFPFSQLRRVISTQVHYFDHPMFGMIMQIRRYDMPLVDTEETE